MGGADFLKKIYTSGDTKLDSKIIPSPIKQIYTRIKIIYAQNTFNSQDYDTKLWVGSIAYLLQAFISMRHSRHFLFKIKNN